MAVQPGAGSYSYNVLPLLKDYVGTDTKVAQFMEMCLESKDPMILMPDGTLDITRVLSRNGSPPDWDNVQIIMDTNQIPDRHRTLSEGVREMLGLSLPFYDTFIDGKYTIFLGDAAVLFFQQELMGQQESSLTQPPVLLYLGGDLAPITVEFDSEIVETVAFCSTFKTAYGESAVSNILTFVLTGWTNVTLAVDQDVVPSYAERVYYYRSFNNVFFRVGDVAL